MLITFSQVSPDLKDPDYFDVVQLRYIAFLPVLNQYIFDTHLELSEKEIDSILGATEVKGKKIRQDKYDKLSTIFAAKDENGGIIATIRLIHRNKNQLEVEEIFPEIIPLYLRENTGICETGRGMVLPELQGKGILSSLLLESMLYAIEKNYGVVFAETYLKGGWTLPKIGFRFIAGPRNICNDLIPESLYVADLGDQDSQLRKYWLKRVLQLREEYLITNSLILKKHR